MIISASRRTDIPAFYSDWFFNRIKAGNVLVPNPYNTSFISDIQLHPKVVDCIIFWTKNPAPLLHKMDTLKDYKYYFQFTLNPYEKDIEACVPSVIKRIETFKHLADKIGKEKVIWRYDPILINEKYDIYFHKEAFAKIAFELKDHTERCMIGFIDHYHNIQSVVNKLNIHPLKRDDIYEMAKSFLETMQSYSIHLETCTVKLDLTDIGIPSGMCIDKELIEKITGYPLAAKKDKNQRGVCNCIESIDIGMYSSCTHGCIYCYAVKNNARVRQNMIKHDKISPMFIGNVSGKEVIKSRTVKSLRSDQQSLF